MSRPVVWHIPICPFSQRLEILLRLRGIKDRVEFRVVDITKPYPDDLLEKLDGNTTLPAMELPDGTLLRESLVLLDFLDDLLPGDKLRRADPADHAIERMMVARFEDRLVRLGYGMVLNQDREKRDEFESDLLAVYREIDAFLARYATGETYLFGDFGYVETVFTTLFQRFWFLDYYENFTLPDTSDYARVRPWMAACRADAAASQVSEEEIVKCYYDYALGVGNGGTLPGREKSSFTFEPNWRDRPWPPRQKYGPSASDAELGLTG